MRYWCNVCVRLWRCSTSCPQKSGDTRCVWINRNDEVVIDMQSNCHLRSRPVEQFVSDLDVNSKKNYMTSWEGHAICMADHWWGKPPMMISLLLAWTSYGTIVELLMWRHRNTIASPSSPPSSLISLQNSLQQLYLVFYLIVWPQTLYDGTNPVLFRKIKKLQ